VSVTIREALDTGTQWLRDAGVEGADRDVQILLAHAIGSEPSRLLLMAEQEVLPEQFRTFDGYLAAREQFQPVAQIIGSREFWGRRFKVTRDVLDPRPDTETLIEQALALGSQKSVLDIGTGSGILALTLAAEWPAARVVAADISDNALEVARENALNLGVEQRVEFALSDWFEAIMGTYDLIVSNPPYIAIQEMAGLSPDVRNWEPFIALTPGGDGLDAYRHISMRLSEFMTPDGVAIFEIGYAQGGAVQEIFRDAGFTQISLVQDINGLDRVVIVKN